MKYLLILVTLITLSGTLYSQHHIIDIPEIKNLDSQDKYPERSILASYTTNFDILISLKNYSAWGPDDHIKVLAYHVGEWYKIEINGQPGFNPYTVCYSAIKINDEVGDTVLNILKENHLFDMIDERSGQLSNCGPVADTIITNGEKQISYTFCDISDGPEYDFELITAKKYKRLYFYSPQYIYRCCPGYKERKWILNCINAFEKYLGK